MTTFSLTAMQGKRRKRPVTLTWTDGVVTGSDKKAVAQMEQLAHDFDGALLGPPNGPYTTEQHLASPYTARMLMLMVLRYKATAPPAPFPARPTLRLARSTSTAHRERTPSHDGQPAPLAP